MSVTVTINCGRCAHLWGQAHPGQIRPKVRLDSTCKHAQLSAKFDPHFIPRMLAERRGEIYPETEP